MGVATKAILFGNVTGPEIAAVLKKAFPTIDTFKTDAPTDGDFFRLIFADPNQDALTSRDAKHRMLYVWPPESDLSDNLDVYDGKRTVVDLNSWGSHKEIIETLAKEFGGFVSIADSKEWTTFEPSKADLLDIVSPEDKLKIMLARSLPLSQATLLAKLVDTPELIEEVVQQFSDYLEVKNAVSANPKP